MVGADQRIERVVNSVYISGPMRHKPGFNFDAFDQADKVLQEHGYTTFNPAAKDRANGFDFSTLTGEEDLSEYGFNLREALGEDLQWICAQADLVIVLPGWEKSLGAKAEVAAAQALGIPVRTLENYLWCMETYGTVRLVEAR